MFKDVTEGKVVDTFKAMVEAMFKGAATAKGALRITREKRSLQHRVQIKKGLELESKTLIGAADTEWIFACNYVYRWTGCPETIRSVYTRL